MKIIYTKNKLNYSLKTQEISPAQVSALKSKHARAIVKLIHLQPLYPKQIALKLKMHEQKVYYYIHQLEKAEIIEVVRQERMQGVMAKFYSLKAESLFIPLGTFKESTKLDEPESDFLKPFIEKGELNALIVVGSPDPHGPLKARSRDGYFGMDFALFLGTYLHSIPESRVRLDTEIHDKELKENNLIIIGGPIVNKTAELAGKDLPIYYDAEKKGFYSTLSKKLYVHEEVGIIVKSQNPFNKDKKILFIAGIRNFGTKASILAFLKHFSELEKGNHYDSKVMCKVVEGIDLDSDGVVDDAEILE